MGQSILEDVRVFDIYYSIHHITSYLSEPLYHVWFSSFLDSLFILFLFVILSAKRVSLARRLAEKYLA